MVAPVAATLAWLRFQKEAAKSEAAKISPSDLGKEGVVFLVFVGTAAQNQLEWEHGREFSYHGEMYDVIEYKISGDTAFYWCWHDKKETWLNKQFDELIEGIVGADPANPEATSRLILYYKSLYFHCANEPLTLCVGNGIEMRGFSFLMRLCAADAPPQSPPPEFASANDRTRLGASSPHSL
jgi:Methionine synthase I, cobalamin-binding domain